MICRKAIALRGKPLFRRIEDDEVAAAEGNSPGPSAAKRVSGVRAFFLEAYALRFLVDTVYVPSRSSANS